MTDVTVGTPGASAESASATQRYVHALVSVRTAQGVLETLCAYLVATFSVDAASAMLGGASLAWCGDSPESIAVLTRTERDSGSGPGVDAMRTGAPVAASDLTDPSWRDQWPDYCAVAERAGIRSVAGVPIIANGSCSGFVTLWSRCTRPWSQSELFGASAMALVAAGLVGPALEAERQRRTAEQLEQALNNRATIEQAKGIIAATQGVSVDQAFKTMRRHARNQNLPIYDVARLVIDRRRAP